MEYFPPQFFKHLHEIYITNKLFILEITNQSWIFHDTESTHLLIPLYWSFSSGKSGAWPFGPKRWMTCRLFWNQIEGPLSLPPKAQPCWCKQCLKGKECRCRHSWSTFWWSHLGSSFPNHQWWWVLHVPIWRNRFISLFY